MEFTTEPKRYIVIDSGGMQYVDSNGAYASIPVPALAEGVQTQTYLWRPMVDFMFSFHPSTDTREYKERLQVGVIRFHNRGVCNPIDISPTVR